MHMADALLSPAVGGTMAAVSAGAIALSVKKISGGRLDEKKIPMMGVMGAFVFAAQMINFTIPGTGSSGHIGGGILLAAVLGPFPALLTISAVLIIQCLLFADGGLLALGCNIFNMGVCACVIGWPLIYRTILRRGITKKRITAASVLSVVAALQLGAFCVVLETKASGVTALPFQTFLLLMQPIHLAIGLVEGLATAAVLCFLYTARPELLTAALEEKKLSVGIPLKKVLITFAALAALLAGVVSLYASQNPDGLEWAIRGITGSTELKSSDSVHKTAGEAVKKTALLPDYSTDSKGGGTAAAGLIGSAVSLGAAAGIGAVIHGVRRRKRRPEDEVKS